jgi:hypothetical protein
MIPARCSVDPSTFIPRLFHGETAQGFWTVTYVQQCIRSRNLDQHPHTSILLRHLLYVLGILRDTILIEH